MDVDANTEQLELSEGSTRSRKIQLALSFLELLKPFSVCSQHVCEPISLQEFTAFQSVLHGIIHLIGMEC